MSIWYYAGPDRQQHGPVTADALRELVGTGQLDASTLVWREGMPQWRPLAEVSADLGLVPDRLPEPDPAPGMPGAGANPYAAPTAPAYAAAAPRTPVEPIPNHLVWGILTTLLCCWPFGVVSIVYATKVERRRAEGDAEGAWEASRKAKVWALWSAGSVGILVVLGLAFALVGEMSR
jgi:hypothetical protein